MKKTLILSLLTASFAGIAPLYAQGHAHTYAGDNNDDGYLDFRDALPSVSLTDNPATVAAGDGYAFSGSFTHTAQHSRDNPFVTDIDPDGALHGTYIYLVLQSVSGPSGATFAFYEEDDTAPQFTLQVGQVGGTLDYGFALTEAAWFEDPYGHIHGRTFAVDLAGTYTVTWALFNGEPGGTLSSIANPDENQRYFTQTFVAAVPEPGTLALLGAATALGAMSRRKRRKTVA